MNTLVLLVGFTFAGSVWALDTATLRAGFNLRDGAGGNILRTNQKTQTVLVMEPGKKWTRICLGSREENCKGGQSRWVINRAIFKDRETPKKPDDAPDATAARTDATCEGDCKKAKNGMNRKVNPILDAVEPNGIPGLKLDARFNPRCGNFINKKGIGEWGKHMISAAHRVAPNCFYGRNLYGSLCPNYLDLPQEKKEAMTALAFAAMGQVESTCNPKASAKGTNDIADGIFQLEYSASQRDDAGRDEKWCRTNQTVDTQSWEFQSECAASIVKDRICKFGAYFFGPRSYWQELKSGKGDIAQLIYSSSRSSGLCKD